MGVAVTNPLMDATPPRLGPKRRKKSVANASAMSGFEIHVRNFGPISSGSVTMAPLVVLVGKNSTGKSYMASLLWAILSGDALIPTARRAWKAPAAFVDAALSARKRKDQAPFSVPVSQIRDWVNGNIESSKGVELSRIFSSEGVAAEEISISFTRSNDLKAAFEPWDDEDEDGALASWGWRDENTLQFSLSEEYDDVDAPYMSLAQRALLGTRRFLARPDCVYVPAARTGLILALDTLVEASLGALGAEHFRPRTKLPLPTIRFLQQLSRKEPQNALREFPEGRFSGVADFLESGVLGGKVSEKEQEGGVSEYYFESEGSGLLPLFVTSSMVTEIAPISVLLRRARSRYFVIEEPEAHLHLSAQREMARAIVRLVNLGANVVVTTHSDTFLQQLNLSIALGAEGEVAAKMRAKHGYSEDDVLKPGSALCFEFVAEPGGTTVKPAPLTDDGFVVKSINEPLYAMADEVLSVQSASAESCE